MYRVDVDGELFADSSSEDYILIDPTVTLEANKAGSFTFTIPSEHPNRDAIKRRKSIITVYRDEELIFQGICVSESEDFYKQKKIECEGELTYLNDSVQRPKRYQGVTPLELLKNYIAVHNAQVDDYKKFEVGNVTVFDKNDYIYCFTNMNSTMTEIKEDLVDDYGGYVRVRYAEGKKYIDYLAGAPRRSSQTIKLGVNLLDYNSNIDNTDISTVVIPLGAKQEESSVEGLETRLTIESVNEGRDYVQNDALIENYGKITKVVTWDDVTTPQALKSKCERYMQDLQFENVVIEVKAVDLGYISDKLEKFQLLDEIKVISPKHGMDRYFPLTKMKLKLNNPENDTFTLGKKTKTSLTAKNNADISSIQKELSQALGNSAIKSILDQAREATGKLLTSADGGYVVFDIDEKTGQPYRILVLDKPDKTKAQKVIQINNQGVGFSHNGIEGPYTNAWTIEGYLSADCIMTGNLNADIIQSGKLADKDLNVVFDLEKGTLTIKKGEINLGDGTFVLNDKGDVYSKGTMEVANVKVTGGSVEGTTIKGSTIKGSTIVTNNRTHALKNEIGLYIDNNAFDLGFYVDDLMGEPSSTYGHITALSGVLQFLVNDKIVMSIDGATRIDGGAIGPHIKIPTLVVDKLIYKDIYKRES